jgi:hypothetical protein
MSIKFHYGLALVLAGGLGVSGCAVQARGRATTGTAENMPPPPPEPVHRPPPPPPENVPPPEPTPPPQPPPRVTFDATGWTLLGERVVEGKNDRDVVAVGRTEGIWNRLMIVVEDSDLEMKNVTVVFGNGQKYSPDLQHYFREDSRTRGLFLPGKTRRIKEIRFRYGNLPGGGRAKVAVYGHEVEPAQPVSKVLKAAEWDKGGWTLLGSRTVQGKRDHDTIRLAHKDPAPIGKVMLVVEDSDLEIHDMTITFGNNSKFTPEVRQYFREDSRTRSIDLPGDTRNIKKIDLRYSNLPGGGKAKVEVWGRAR